MKKIIILLTLFMLTGCWNYRELNQLAITTGVGIDKVDDEFEVTIMIANSKKSGESGKGQASTAVYQGKGKTIYDAFKDTALSVSKQIYLGHIEIILLSEEVLKNDISVIADFLFRYPQTRNEFQIAIARDSKAGDILKVTTPLESFPSQNIVRNLEITDKLQGYTYPVDFNEFIKLTIEKGINPVLPSVYIIGDVEKGNDNDNTKKNQPSTYLKLGTLGLFKENKFVGFASESESKGINIINNKVKVFGVTSDYNNRKLVTEITSMKTKTSIKESKITIKVDCVGGIQEVTSDIDLADEKVIEEIKNVNIETIKADISQAIDLAKKHKTDIFGFGKLLHKSDPSKWMEVKDKWDDEILPNLEIEIIIDLNLENKGTITTDIEVK